MRNTTDIITIRVHPAVFRHMENHFPKIGEAYDMRGHFFYDFLRSGLTRKSGGAAPPQSFAQLLEVEIVFSRRDCQHYGYIIPEVYQSWFSRFAYKFIQHTACMEVLFAHVAGGIPRDTAIKEYLLNNLYEDDELNYPALRKYYQRNWMEAERQVLEEYSELTGRKQLVRSINNSVRNVPFSI